ncbi:hypothetical protein WKS98_03315 [Lagierella sp. ICN-221743]
MITTEDKIETVISLLGEILEEVEEYREDYQEVAKSKFRLEVWYEQWK